MAAAVSADPDVTLGLGQGEGMQLLLVTVGVGAVILLGSVLSRRLHVSEPLVQLFLGVGLGFVPSISPVRLAPDVVLMLVLPALLYWEALTTSFREIRRNLRTILLSAIPLVIVTAAVTAWFGHLAGMSWALALTLGTVVAPTDATAVARFGGGLPRRTLTTLRAESLANDGTALAVYSLAVAAASGAASFDPLSGTLTLVYSYVAAMGIGAVLAWILVVVRRWMRTRVEQNTLSVLSPFVAYLLAESVHASGVVAVVVVGLLVARRTPLGTAAATRVQGFGFWQLASSVVNGALFVLVGMQAGAVFRAVDDRLGTAVALGLGTTAVVIAVRFAWVNTVPYVLRAIDRRPAQRDRRVPFRQRQPFAAAGFRGAVSLAAALAIPESVRTVGFPAARDTIIAITFIVIVLTLVLQGTAMPWLIRAARFPSDEEGERAERLLAERAMLDAALAALPAAAERSGLDQEAREAFTDRWTERLRRLDDGAPEAMAVLDDGERDFLLEIVTLKRRALEYLRSSGRVDDEVARAIQQRLDVEELRARGTLLDE